MKFTKTVRLWANGVQDKILDGKLKLQLGQWVQCGAGPRARFVGIRNGIFYVAHWEGDKKGTRGSFKRLREAFAA